MLQCMCAHQYSCNTAKVGVEHQEEFEDTKVVIRIGISQKNRQHNGEKKMYKRINNNYKTDTYN